MSEGYRYVEGVFGGQAICLETSQMHVSKTEIQSAVFYGKPNDADTFHHFVISKGEGYINGESTISVSVFGLAGEEVFLQDWHNEIATLVSDAIIFNSGFTIDELLVFDRIVTPEEVQQWSDQTQPFIDQSEIDYQFTLIQQTDERITLESERIDRRIDDEVESLESKINVTSDKIESTVYKSLLSSAIAVLRQDVSGNIDTLPVESLKEDLPKGTELVIMDIDTLQTYTVITREDANKNATQILIDATTITANKNSTVHLELSSVASKIAQLADSYTLNIEGDGVVTGFKSALGEDGVSDFVIQADKFRVIGTKNGQPFGEGKSILEVDTDDEKIYLTSDVILKGTLVQSLSVEEPFPIPVFLGEYKPTKTYHRGDNVSYAGASWIYINKTSSEGNAPAIGSEFWELYVAKGEDGQPGQSAPQLMIQYSTASSGATWYDAYATGRKWMRTSADNGVTWSTPAKVVGEDGNDGVDGKYTDYQFAKNTSLTTAPTSGWADAPPSLGTTEYLWMRLRVVTPSGAGSWSTAVRISGPQGSKGDKGDTGLSGPALLYKGPHVVGKQYYANATSRDVVKVGSAYYAAKSNTKTTPPNTTYWEALTSFAAIATDILLAQDANITHGLLVGGGTGNNTAGMSGQGTSATDVRIWAGGPRATAPFRVQQNGKVIAQDGEYSGEFIVRHNNVPIAEINKDESFSYIKLSRPDLTPVAELQHEHYTTSGGDIYEGSLQLHGYNLGGYLSYAKLDPNELSIGIAPTGVANLRVERTGETYSGELRLVQTTQVASGMWSNDLMIADISKCRARFDVPIEANAGIVGGTRIVDGTYTGNSTSYDSTSRRIILMPSPSFTPKLVMVVRADSSFPTRIAMTGMTFRKCHSNSSSVPNTGIVTDGFRVSNEVSSNYEDSGMNYNGKEYRWIAIG